METENKVLLIINPMSGRRKSRRKLFDILKLLSDHGFETTVILTRASRDAIEIVADKAAEYGRVVCCGGDGTFNEIVSGVMRSHAKPVIGYIPAGTTNDLARSLRLPRDIVKAARMVIHGRPVYHDIGLLGESAYFTYIASFGAFTKASYSTPQRLKNMLGHFAYKLQGIQSIGEIRPCHVRVKANDRELEGDFVYGGVSNTLSVGGMVTLPAGEVCLNDGLFEVMLVRNPCTTVEFGKILHALNTRDYHNEEIVFFHADRVEFFFDKDIDWTADGEFGGSFRHAEIRLIHNQVRVIQMEEGAEKDTANSF